MRFTVLRQGCMKVKLQKNKTKNNKKENGTRKLQTGNRADKKG